ncbi:response regulator transcription factor [Rhodobacterales bacterium]|nr:response regulator transcription factor [Rhodobacterales bacterium]
MIVHIVEDDWAVADAMAMALSDHYTESRTYPDGETFLAQANVSEADWVIVDLGLPGITGAEVIRELRRLETVPRILAISGSSRTSIKHALERIPQLKVLRKPLSVEMLCEAMQ